jgi:hypothetical protein
MDEIKFIEDLVCPIGKYPLVQKDGGLECTNCQAQFPIDSGIPLLLIDDAILPDGVNSIEDLKCYIEANKQ